MTALAMKQKDLKPATKIVLYWIADHYNDDTKACFPSQTRLAQLCQMTRTSVNNHILLLREKKIITTTQRHRPDGGKSTLGYELHLKDDVKDLNNPCKNNLQGHDKKIDNNNLVNNNHVNDNEYNGSVYIIDAKEYYETGKKTLAIFFLFI